MEKYNSKTKLTKATFIILNIIIVIGYILSIPSVSVKDVNSIVGIIVFSILAISIELLFFFNRKNFFKETYFDKEGIHQYVFKKKIKSIKWDEIKTIVIYKCLIVFVDKDEFEFNWKELEKYVSVLYYKDDITLPINVRKHLKNIDFQCYSNYDKEIAKKIRDTNNK